MVNLMKRRKPSFARALLLLVVAVGPLQAQSIFACGMMDTIVHDECCCGEHDSAELASGESPCCEHSVEIGVDQEATQDASVAKPAKIDSDADPPRLPVFSSEILFAPEPLRAPPDFVTAPAAPPAASDTYLTTQRLRI